MANVNELRNTFTFEDYNTALSRADYDRFFTKTKETVRFTFHGWDGKSYDGESRNAKVIRCNKPGYEAIRFIKVGKHLCSIDEDDMVIEKATGEKHPSTDWFAEIKRA